MTYDIALSYLYVLLFIENFFLRPLSLFYRIPDSDCSNTRHQIQSFLFGLFHIFILIDETLIYSELKRNYYARRCLR